MESGSRPRTTATEHEIDRRPEPLDLRVSPTELLRALPALPRLVALVGDWVVGRALVSWDPVRMAEDPFGGEIAGDAVGDGGDDAPGPGGPWAGAWIGAWGYQLGGRLERLPPPPRRPVPQPHHRIGFYDWALRYRDDTWWFEQRVPPGESSVAATRRDEVLATVAGALAATRRGRDGAPPEVTGFEMGPFRMVPTPQEHRDGVVRCQQHIVAGDIFQANLAARMEASFSGDPLRAFCAGVDRLSPAYAAYVGAPDGAVLSLSPELFLRRTGREVVSSPIKGTAPLTSDPQALARSSKDRAENVMIVDVMRNDLGRVARAGGVEVPALNRVERHTVWHLVSDVVGTLPPGVSDADLLRATFPPASVTGAPKIRAMEILAELEATARETYTGAIGVVGGDGGLELNVAIRTFEVAGGRIWLGVGGGIVSDSDPAAEYDECLAKAGPLIAAIGGTLADPEETARSSVHAVAPPRSVRPGDLDVFDTLLVEDGAPADPGPHLRRLSASVAELSEEPLDPSGLDELVRRHARALVGPHRLRVDVAIDGARDPRVKVSSSPLATAPTSLDLVPWTVPGGLGRHKWADRERLGSALPWGQDRLVLDTDGSVLETGRAGLVVVLDDQVVAPALDGRLLPSTGRERVAAALQRVDAELVERRLWVADLARADEVLTVNALRGVVPVASVEGVGRWSAGFVGPWLASQLAHRDSSVPVTTAERVTTARPAQVLIVDNYDSFTFNLAQAFRARGHQVAVVRNDAVSVEEVAGLLRARRLTHLVLSPGPGGPDDAGVSRDLVRRLGDRLPILGICLGHQVVGAAFGADVVRAPLAMHGKRSLVEHDGRGVYAGLPTPLAVGRYHSLAIATDTVPDELLVTSRTANGTVMGLRHRLHPVESVQWHPESILTRQGGVVLENFLQLVPPG